MGSATLNIKPRLLGESRVGRIDELQGRQENLGLSWIAAGGIDDKADIILALHRPRDRLHVAEIDHAALERRNLLVIEVVA